MANEPDGRVEQGALLADEGAPTVLDRGPGVHVVADAHPARAGRILAADLGADLADTPMTAERAIKTRLRYPRIDGVGRGAHVLGNRAVIDLTDGSSDAEIERRLDKRLAAQRTAAPLRTLTAAHRARLGHLAEAVERADRIRARTERAAQVRVEAALQTDLAVHPDTLRLASAGVLRARQEVSELETASAVAAEPEPGVQVVQTTPTPMVELAAAAAAPAILPVGSDPIALGVILLGIALAGAILLASVPHVLALGPFLLALFIAGIVRRGLRSEMPVRTTDHQATSIRVQRALGKTVSVDALTAHQARARPPEVSEAATGDQPTAGLRRARKELEQAEHRWALLAGPDFDPSDVAALVSRGDPNARQLELIAAQSAAVRTAKAFSERARHAWAAAWTELDEEAPVDATVGKALDTALDVWQHRVEDESASRHDEDGSAVEEQVVRGSSPPDRLRALLAGRTLEAVVEWESGPAPTSVAPLVLVEPFRGLTPDRRAVLRSQLEALADRHEVIVIVRDGADSR